MQPAPKPSDPRHAFGAAFRLHQEHRLAEAEAAYKDILASVPDHVDSLQMLGAIANQTGRYEAAVEFIGRAIALRRHNPVPQLHNNIGVSHKALGQLDTALSHFKSALALKPDSAETQVNLGAVLQELGRLDEAEAHVLQALTLKPDYAGAHFVMGNILRQRHRFEDAAAAYGQAISFRPSYAEAINNLCSTLRDLGRIDEAIGHHRLALKLKPDYASAEYNLGVTLERQFKLDEALESYIRAQVLAPGNADAHWNEALLRLLRGEFAVGWQKYEWRLKRPGTKPRQFSQPRWDGGDLTGQAILLHAEQGYGDTIQFIRYASLVKARGATVIVACQLGLERLLTGVPDIGSVITEGAPLPPFDCHAPLLSLPYIFRTDGDSVPDTVPYLHAQPDLAEQWRSRLGEGAKLKVGIVWHGNPTNTINRTKSIPVERMAPLCAIPGIDWVSLQADATPDEIAALSGQSEVRDYGRSLTDWADTAALISTLDLVITVDTGVAHLAGALGKPAWVLLSYVPDWRWQLERADSPWYPTLRLFRQSRPDDWVRPLSQVETELRQFSARLAAS